MGKANIKKIAKRYGFLPEKGYSLHMRGVGSVCEARCASKSPIIARAKHNTAVQQM